MDRARPLRDVARTSLIVMSMSLKRATLYVFFTMLCGGALRAEVAYQPSLVDDGEGIDVYLFFDGQPLTTSAPPAFDCKDEDRGAWVGCKVRPNPSGGFVMSRLPPGRYLLHVKIDENTTNPARFPGDYDVFHPFTITPEGPPRLEVPLLKVLHVTAPWDNNLTLNHMLGHKWDEKPAFETPRFSLTGAVPVTFSWEPLAPGAEYEYVVLPTQAQPFQRGADLIRKKTSATSVTLRLPPSFAGHYYVFGLSAS